jgi:tetratricopeptide (TPR) repeat protein
LNGSDAPRGDRRHDDGVRTIVLVAIMTSTAYADQWVAPTARTLTSPNGKLQAVITPSTDGKSHASVAIGPKLGTAKKRALDDPWMPVDALLFDDGSLLTLDHWHQLGYGDVATLYGADGHVRWTRTLEQLIGAQLVDRAPHSVSSIWWRKQPFEWTLATDGKSGTITLFDENQLKLGLADGSATVVPVASLPDDPPRLVNRARALAADDAHRDEAIALLERAIAKDPDLFEALLLEVEVLQRANDHVRASALLDRVSPRWTGKTGYDFANAYVSWATSLKALARLPEAEQKLRLGVAAAPTYTRPVIELATLLADQKRTKDAYAVLDGFVGRLFAAPSLDTYALADIAGFYATHKDTAKALATYLKGYKKDAVTNQFLYASLAQLYEATGNTAEAIRVQEQLLAYYQTMGSGFDTYASDTRGELARLRAKAHP